MSHVIQGRKVYYVPVIEELATAMKEAKPTMFFGVPRIWEKFQAALSARLAEATGVKKVLMNWAMSVGRDFNAKRIEGIPCNASLTMQYKVADQLVYKKIKEKLGIGDVRMFFTAAAPISQDVLEFFASIGVLIQEMYGETETAGPITLSRIGNASFNAVGTAFPGMEIRIEEDGEICATGPNIFPGYYKNEEATKEVLVDGWLYTGDLGSLDDKGRLSITGRKKDIIVTAGGKNVSPVPIEGKIKECPLVEEAVVIGDKRKYLSALVTLNVDEASKVAGQLSASREVLATDTKVRYGIQKVIDAINKEAASVRQIKRFTILTKEFTIEDGELTPTMKLKRNVITLSFAQEIDAMYQDA